VLTVASDAHTYDDGHNQPLIVAIRGHQPQLHGESWVVPNVCVIGKMSMGAVILNGAVVGSGSLVAAGA
jgi:carbonic anhydrase/acetyltransferase-like protein (isoleucine patch superfamily)